ncbi:hypothetical protein [Micromonospora sp. HUAS LYJ1]|uniref:hypothetical protein n=1 Tax=Micromonospora sp. HUAS LYJ1 TaxID=3061626 RepID=UPI0026739F9D|nr:hypothetical protein [Micromonospora sp. HUAS LYJ1]WKU03761.1 hypothetical protein Q2K16_23395 [Micromonospora sp. HUAS LYJ1]
MTTAPANLLAVRRLLLDTIKGLDPAAVGIVGDPAHRGGYHTGSDRVVSGDYSVVESSRDRTGLTEHASALDVGSFAVTVGGKRYDLRHLSAWLVDQCKAGTADTRDIREVIYSPDGKVVRRWDRLGRRSTGDDSHLWHTHISYHRDAIKAGRDQTAVIRRYLTHIGLIKAPTVEVPVAQDPVAWATTNRTAALLSGAPADYQIDGEKTRRREPNRIAEALARIEAKAEATLAAVKGVDGPGIIARINEVAAAEVQRDAQALAELTGRLDAVADLLRRLESGELTAEQVLTKLRDLLPTGAAPVPGQARE